MSDLLTYYAARAAEYENVYAKPERQSDLARLRETVPAYFVGRRVLEVACGTGYWTRLIAPHATRTPTERPQCRRSSDQWSRSCGLRTAPPWS